MKELIEPERIAAMLGVLREDMPNNLNLAPGYRSVLASAANMIEALSQQGPRLPSQYRVRRDSGGDFIVFLGHKVAFTVLQEDREMCDFLEPFLPTPEKADEAMVTRRPAHELGAAPAPSFPTPETAAKPVEKESLVDPYNPNIYDDTPGSGVLPSGTPSLVAWFDGWFEHPAEVVTGWDLRAVLVKLDELPR